MIVAIAFSFPSHCCHQRGQTGRRAAAKAEPRRGREAERAHRSALQRLADRFLRLGVQRPEVLDAATGELLLKHREVRIPATAEVLRAGAAGDAAVREDEPGALAFGDELVSDV